MHDVGLDQYLKSLHQILEIPNSLLLTEMPLPLDLLVQSTAIAKLIDEVVIVGSLENLDESDHMGSILDLGQGLDFIDGEFLEFRAELKLLHLDDLDGHGLPVLLVDRLVHLTELALSDHVVQYVIFYLFAHRYCLLGYYNNQINRVIKSGIGNSVIRGCPAKCLLGRFRGVSKEGWGWLDWSGS